MTRVLVCGGRFYVDFEFVGKTLTQVHQALGITLLIHGGASGVDSLANAWADSQKIPVQVFPVDWENGGLATVPARNALMLANGKPDHVVAFTGGPGTLDLLERVRAAGLPIWPCGEPAA
jgi:YspA, cpYpsA-related SLOG family